MRLPLPATAGNRIAMALALLLGALAVYPWLAPVPANTGAMANGGASRRAPAVAPMPPLTTFSAVFDRPLFSASRRPPAAALPSKAELGAAANYRLIGVVDVPGSRHALVTDGNRTREVQEGETLGGWTLSRIEHDGLVLSSAAGRMLLPLRRDGPVTPPTPAPAPPQP